MFRHIMVPVDLAHVPKLARALGTAADLARHWDAAVIYVGVTSDSPTALAHNPAEYGEKLAAFAAAQAQAEGITATAHAVIADDPAAEMDNALMRAIDETGAELVVMQSHIPGLLDYLWPSNGGKLAGHAKASVLVVRG